MSSIRYAIDGDQCFIKLCGGLRHLDAPGFDALVQQVCANGGPRRFIVDLTMTEYMDSTILGVLAGVARWAHEQGLERPVLAGPAPDVAIVLFSMGFEHYIAIEEPRKETANKEMVLASVESYTDSETANLVLEAHRALMTMNEKNRDEFRDVVELLAQDIDTLS